ncbi:hypothetical protein JCM10212_002153 [Sporobolomyces blumeae]
MHARLIASTRLAARYAQTGLQSRVQASKVLNLAASSHKLAFQPRAFTSARALFDDAKTSAAVNEAVHSGESSELPAAGASAPAPSELEAVADVSEGSSASTSASTSSPSESASPVTEPTESTTPADAAQEPAAAATHTPATAPVVDPEEVVKRTVFVGGLSWNVDNQWLEDEVHKALDLEEGVTGVRIARNPLGRSKGFAFVELSSPDLASQLNGRRLEIDGREVEFVLSTSSAKPRAPRGEGDRDVRRSAGARNPPSSTLWIGNVAWSASRESLEDAFERYGTVVRVSQPTDRETGRSRGIAYVEFSTLEEAEEAHRQANEHGVMIEGRSIRVDFAPPSRPNAGGTRHRDGGYKPRGGNRNRGERRGGYDGGRRYDGEDQY